MLIDVKYTRDWQLGLKKNSQDSAVKPIIFMTYKMKFSIKNKLNNFLTKKFIFYAFICASRQNTTVI